MESNTQLNQGTCIKIHDNFTVTKWVLNHLIKAAPSIILNETTLPPTGINTFIHTALNNGHGSQQA